MSGGWRPRLAGALRERPSPVLVAGDDVVPGASLWVGSRRWVDAFRAAGLRRGDRVVLALAPSAAFVQVLVAALWEGLALAVAPPGPQGEGLLEDLDARLLVAADRPGPGVWVPDGPAGPGPARGPLRPASLAPTSAACLLLRTSGTTGGPRWVALSERGVCAVLDSHLPALGVDGAHVVSALPWHHAFGLVLDLLPALLRAASLVRDPAGGRDPAALAALLGRGPAVLSAVPATAAALAGLPGGAAVLAGIAGGVVGGAPVGADLAGALRGTALRAGYGQTEASPGIALGAPGRWRAGYLGRPLGCSVRLVGGELQFSGPNACLGTWGPGGLPALDPARWVGTGDAVELVPSDDSAADGVDGGDLVFAGRTADHFKLGNGRWVATTVHEPAVRAALAAQDAVTAGGAVDSAVLCTPDGAALDLVLVVAPGTARDAGADGRAARTALGPLGGALRRVVHVPRDRVVTDAKGAVDRAATVREALR